MGWFEAIKTPKLKKAKKGVSNTPTGLWKKCTNCGEIIQSSKLDSYDQVCPYCDQHFRLSAQARLNLLVDSDSFKPFGESLATTDPFQFVDKKSYQERLKLAHDKCGALDGAICGIGKIAKRRVSLGIMNFQFMGGSMGVVTGEKMALVMDKAFEEKIPAIIVSSSGGARMQEGILSLMQMGKTSAARQRLKKAGIPFISVLTDPPTGGVAASFAMLGDVNIAEPKALIGFAGPRVIEQSIRQTLPEGFQRAEFLLDHGFIDRIVHRKNLKSELQFFIEIFSNKLSSK